MKRVSGSKSSLPAKKVKLEENLTLYTRPNKVYYKNPITCGEANKFNNNKRKRPIDIINNLRVSPNALREDPKTFIHWFRSDLRVADNTSLFNTVNEFLKVKENDASYSLAAIFIINENDWRAHLDGGWKLNFMLDALASLKEKLAKMAIPLHILKFEPENALLSNSSTFAKWFKDSCLELCNEGRAVTVSANCEYETDELYRDLKILRERDDYFNFQVYHDTCALEPGLLRTGKNSIYTLFTPWYKKWAIEVENNIKKKKDSYLLNIDEKTKYNAEFKLQELDYCLPEEFTAYIPASTKSHVSASEKGAFDILSSFLNSKVHSYDKKDILTDEGSSHLSCYLSLGIISSRTIIYESFSKSKAGLISKDIKKNSTLQEFVREVAWRDFYKNAICYWPYLTMDLPFKFEMIDLKWNHDEELFRKWCEGNTGIPIVDAIMKKLLHTGYINNRARMIVASFLSKNLLLDWRWGERWFRRHLVDYDLSSNIGGWGFCSSTGIDAQPYFRIFNMELQSKKYDPDGAFIKKWIPELTDSPDVHVLDKVEGYGTPVVDLKDSRNKALEAYRQVV